MQSDRLSPKAQTLRSQPALKPSSSAKKSINAYTEELKIKVDQMSASGVGSVSEEEPGQDESSGYVIDYEQVLKDN